MAATFKNLLLSFSLILLSCLASAQTPFFKQVVVNRENNNLGFNSICIDTNRVIWLASEEGLFKYNGLDYQPYIYKTREGLVDEVTAVFADRKGVIWAGYKSGTIAFITDTGLTLLSGKLHTHEVITTIFEDSHGVKWFTTGGDGVYYLIKNKLQHIGMNEDLADDYCYAVTEDKNGRIWIATDQGISWVEKTGSIYKVIKEDINNQLPDVIVRDLEKDRNGDIWIALQDSGVCRYKLDEKRIEMPQWSRKWESGAVLDLYFNRNEIWIGTEGHGVFYGESNSAQLKSYKSFGDFVFNDVKKIIADPEENLWLASGNGLIRSHSQWLTFLNKSGTQKLSYIHSIYCNSSNDIYLTPDYGLLRLNNEGQITKRYTASFFNEHIDLVSLFEDDCGFIWMGTMGAGLFRLNTITGVIQKINDPEINDASILSIDGRDDEIWLATFGGAYYCKIVGGCLTDKPKVKITKLDKEPTLGNFYIYTVFIDSRNRVWFGTDKMGLTCYANGKYLNYSVKQGLRSNTVYSITEDNKGAIWFSTPDEGVCRFDGRTFRNYGKAEGLRELSVTAIKYVSFDRIIMLHKKGIDVLHTSTGKIDYYGAENNLADINPDLNSITVDQSGKVWIGTEKGVVIYNPSQNINPAGPAIILSKVALIGGSRNLIKRHEYRYNQNSFVFDFMGVWYTDPSRINYQYMLEGYNTNWISTKDMQVVFPNLPPRTYVFKVRASLSPSFNVSTTTSYTFTIRKPVWKENWFVITGFILFVVVALIIIRNRDIRLKGIEALKKESVEYRFETLKSQVNPHFLFNSFNTLIAIIEKDKDIAIEYVEKLSDYFRNMIQHRDKETILLKDEIEMVKTYSYLQKKRFGDYLILHVDLSQDLLNNTKVPPLSIQLLIENAVKHNAVSKDTPLRVEVFQSGENQITVKNNVNVKMTPEISTGIGLQNIINRYKILTNEKVQIEFNQEIFSITLPLIR